MSLLRSGADCSYCAALTIEKLTELAEEEFRGSLFPQQAYYRHQPSLAALEQSASNGCRLCGLMTSSIKMIDVESEQWTDDAAADSFVSIYDAATGLEESDIKLSIDSTQVYMGDSAQQVPMWDLLLVQIGEVQADDSASDFRALPTVSLTLSTRRGRALELGGIQLGRFQTPRDMAHSSNFALANTWLEECRDTHGSCAHLNQPQELPKRVVDVGTWDDQPRVYCSTPGGRAPYVALSHCWGGDIPVKLTVENLSRYQTALPYDLPANFLDAIEITRQIGTRYIWIDCLCILQDSQQDWQQEAAKMESIYRHARVVLAAMSADKSTHGILRLAPKPPPSSPPLVNIRVFGHDETTEPYALQAGLFNPAEENLAWLDIKGPLCQRGWTLQEAVLASRQLFFGREQLYWKCPQGYNSSRGQAKGVAWSYKALSPYLHSETLLPSPSEMLEVFNDFYSLVVSFTQRKLTVSSDKLVAFAAIAQRMHRFMGGDYLAGIWSNDLATGLLWRSELQNTAHVTSPYRAPSWSWAVTDQSVILDSRTDLHVPNWYDMRLVKSSVTPADPSNPFGKVLNAMLEVEAIVVPLRRSSQRMTGLGFSGIGYSDVGTIQFDVPENDVALPRHGISDAFYVYDDVIQSHLLSLYVLRDFENNGQVEVIDKSAIWLTAYHAAVVEVETDPATQRPSKAQGIILLQVGVDEASYERVGYFAFGELGCERLGVERRQKTTLRLV